MVASTTVPYLPKIFFNLTGSRQLHGIFLIINFGLPFSMESSPSASSSSSLFWPVIFSDDSGVLFSTTSDVFFERSLLLAMSTLKICPLNLVFLALARASFMSSSTAKLTNPKPLALLFVSLTTTACLIGAKLEKKSASCSSVTSWGIDLTNKVFISRPSSFCFETLLEGTSTFSIVSSISLW
ncbi:EC1118_1P2_2619p [Saccharomyces cerevisiae EC1118]|uniref:EC1118_1P2_2619p n=1 Tax=Saccharomyces cerevisiae (strain Lalvin EC1118 / Prise de mousse) TaxID=643680 RepID=C8ZIY5_YEAS8|nr:EC1118_1P2_2619p [Saccharomyces cerevisiae EC1118]